MAFDAIKVEMQASIEIGRTLLAPVCKAHLRHRNVRLNADRPSSEERVVFDLGHLSQCIPQALEAALTGLHKDGEESIAMATPLGDGRGLYAIGDIQLREKLAANDTMAG